MRRRIRRPVDRSRNASDWPSAVETPAVSPARSGEPCKPHCRISPGALIPCASRNRLMHDGRMQATKYATNIYIDNIISILTRTYTDLSGLDAHIHVVVVSICPYIMSISLHLENRPPATGGRWGGRGAADANQAARTRAAYAFMGPTRPLRAAAGHRKRMDDNRPASRSIRLLRTCT